MRVDGSFPMHIARAYGLSGVKQVHPTHKLSLSSQASTIGAPSSISKSPGIDKLLAGKVSQPIDFNTTATPGVQTARDALPLYTRAADRAEAATSVQIGRELDVKG